MTAHPGPASAARRPEPVRVTLPITLGQFVKVAGLASTGGEAKLMVTSGLVTLNGSVDTRRGHKLLPGDIVESRGIAAQVVERAPGARPTVLQG